MTKAAEAKVGTVDLAALDVAEKAEEGAELSLVHPVSGEEIGVFLRLAGQDSATYVKAVRSVAAKRVMRKRMPPTSEELAQEAREILARVTLDWRGVKVDGQTLPYSRENALALYRRFSWIQEQAEGFVHDRGNYLQD